MAGMAVAAVLLWTGLASMALAAPPGHGGDRGKGDFRQERDYRSHDSDRGHDRGRDWVVDRRYNHNRSYPRRGYSVRELPRGYREFRHHHDRYFFGGGVWYRAGVSGFIVVTPPIGLTLSLLPPYYTTIWVGGVPYYYADDVYYRWLPQQRVYVVSEPPPAKEVVEDSSLPKNLYIYPKIGQSPEQQATDRYECHSWAVDQTGFDPIQPGGNVPADQNTVRRADYQRAMKACLEARDYSVQ